MRCDVNRLLDTRQRFGETRCFHVQSRKSAEGVENIVARDLFVQLHQG